VEYALYACRFLAGIFSFLVPRPLNALNSVTVASSAAFSHQI
jgi:hypothetical protein